MFFVVEKWEMAQYKLEVSPLLIPSQVDWEMYPYLEPDTEPDQLQIESFAWRWLGDGFFFIGVKTWKEKWIELAIEFPSISLV